MKLQLKRINDNLFGRLLDVDINFDGSLKGEVAAEFKIVQRNIIVDGLDTMETYQSRSIMVKHG